MFPSLLLAHQMEFVQMQMSVNWVTAHRQLHPNSDFTSLALMGGHAIFAGATSPLTQALGMGLVEPITEAQLDVLEAFYQERGAATNIELAPFFDQSLLKVLDARHYKLVEMSNVLMHPLDPAHISKSHSSTSTIEIRPIEPTNVEIWAKTLAQGFMDVPEFADMASMVDMLALLVETSISSYHTANTYHFGAFIDDLLVGGGSLFINEGVALLSGTSTVPKFRGRGVQTALIQTRLQLAQAQGCHFTTVATMPGGVSQHSMEQQGFQSCYTRIKFCKEQY